MAPSLVKSITCLPQGALAPAQGGWGQGEANLQRQEVQASLWVQQEGDLAVNPDPTLPSCVTWDLYLHLSEPVFSPV